MKITMLTSIAGVDFSLSRGADTDRFSDKEAKRLIVAGMAVLATAKPAAETAVKNPVKERAVRKLKAEKAVKTPVIETRG